MAVSDGGAGVWVRQPGADWQKLRNGDDGLFFLLDDDATSWTPEFDDVAAHRWWLNQFLFADYGIAVEDSKTLVYVWFAQQFSQHCEGRAWSRASLDRKVLVKARQCD